MLRWVLLALFFGICASAGKQVKKKVKAESYSRGWGDGIAWLKTYKEALEKLEYSHKPLMVIHHRDECQYSQALKKAFVANKTIQKMAREDFNMLNLVEETTDKNMAPDGYYVPRILFVDPSLTVRIEIKGRYVNHKYSYEPGDMELLASNMLEARKILHSEL